MPECRYHSLPAGRLLDLAVDIDFHDPGFVGFLLRLPRRRRQAAFAAMFRHLRASAGHDRGELDLLKLSDDIRHLKARELIEAHYGTCPDGYLGALAKSGDAPQPWLYYSSLHRELSSPKTSARVAAIRHANVLDFERLHIITTLDPIFLEPRFVRNVTSLRHGHDMNVSLGVIRRTVPGVTDEGLRASIKATSAAPGAWVRSWLFRAVIPQFPVLPLGPHWRGLDTVAAMRNAGRRMGVCLGEPNAIMSSLRGENYYFEDQGRAVIAEVRAFGRGETLVLGDVHRVKNRFVPARLAFEVAREFDAAGVPSLEYRPRPDWDCVERACDHYTSFQPLQADAAQSLRELEVEASVIHEAAE